MQKHHIVIILASITVLSIAVQAAKCPGDAGTSCTAARVAGVSSCKRGVVVAKVQQDLCDWSTGDMSPARRQLMKQQAAAAGLGLSFRFPLPVNCWWAFSRPSGASRRAAAAAIAAVTAKPLGEPDGEVAAGVATTATTAAASAASNPQQQQQLQRVFAVAGIDDLTFAEPEALPAECSSSGSCGPHLYGMRLSRIEALWGEELKDVIPLAEFPYKGTIVDDGVDFNHGNLRGQVDVVSSTTCSLDSGDPATQGLAQVECAGSSVAAMQSCDGHGTLVAGIMAGAWSNGDRGGLAGVVGPAQGGAVVSCNAGSKERSFVDVVRCIAHASAVNASWVVNLSLGTYAPAGGAIEMCYADAIKQHVCNRNGLAVTAAGNGRCIGPDCATLTKCKAPQDCPDGACNCALGPVDHMDSDPAAPGGGVVHVPSSLATTMPDCVIAVAAVDRNNRLGSFSNFGAGVRIVAPGVDITSDLPVAGTKYGYGVISGTSVATPHVSGAALLLRNVFPQAPAREVVRCLTETATQLPSYPEPYRFTRFFPGKSYQGATGGLLNAQAAYACLQHRVGCPVTQRRCGSSCVAATQPCPCSDSSDCPSDETCINSACRRQRRFPGTTDDCRPGTKECNGKCFSLAACCTQEDTCPAGSRCARDGGRCVSSTTSDCPAGRRLCNGKCILQGSCCTSEPEACPAGQICRADGSSCSSSQPEPQPEGCPAGRKECSGRCIPQGSCCSQPDDCEGGTVCSADGGRCVGSQAPECPAVGLPACVNAATGVLLPAGSSCGPAAYCIPSDGSLQPDSPSQSDSSSGSRGPRDSVTLGDLQVAAPVRLSRRQQRAQRAGGNSAQQEPLLQVISNLNDRYSGGGGVTRPSSAAGVCSYQLREAGTVCCSSFGADRSCSRRSTCTGAATDCS